METNTNVTTAQATPSPAEGQAGGGLAFQNASRGGLNIIRKNGQEINKPQATPSPEAVKNEMGHTNDTTNANSSSSKNDANPQSPENQGIAATNVDGNTQPADTNPTPGESGTESQHTLEPDLITLLANRSGGKISKPEDALALVDEVQNLRTQLAERPKIEFPNDQAKQLYEFASKFPGLEMAAAKNLLHIQTLPIDKLDPKEAQFEAFALKKPNWTREQARQYFEEKYDKAYGSGILETSTMAQLDHEEETTQARKELAKFQQEFAAAKPSQQAGEQQTYQLTPEQQDQIRRQAEEVMKGFGGVRYQFVQSDPASTVNVPMDQSALQRFQSYLIDPGEFLKDLFEECKDQNGAFSQVKFRDAMFELANRKKIQETLFNQGKTYGEITVIKERKNTSTPKPNTDSGAPVKPASFQDAWRQAVKGKNVKV